MSFEPSVRSTSGHGPYRPDAQSFHRMGGYKVQGRKEQSTVSWRCLCRSECRAFAVVLEGIPAKLAAEITAGLTIPTIASGQDGLRRPGFGDPRTSWAVREVFAQVRQALCRLGTAHQRCSQMLRGRGQVRRVSDGRAFFQLTFDSSQEQSLDERVETNLLHQGIICRYSAEFNRCTP